jgi:tripartite-type tricarboxylate transporter receptor subunit TctC
MSRIDLPDWKTIPTMKEATGKDVGYLMHRGFFAAPAITKEREEYYAEVFKEVSETPERNRSDLRLGPHRKLLGG